MPAMYSLSLTLCEQPKVLTHTDAIPGSSPGGFGTALLLLLLPPARRRATMAGSAWPPSRASADAVDAARSSRSPMDSAAAAAAAAVPPPPICRAQTTMCCSWKLSRHRTRCPGGQRQRKQLTGVPGFVFRGLGVAVFIPWQVGHFTVWHSPQLFQSQFVVTAKAAVCSTVLGVLIGPLLQGAHGVKGVQNTWAQRTWKVTLAACQRPAIKGLALVLIASLAGVMCCTVQRVLHASTACTTPATGSR